MNVQTKSLTYSGESVPKPTSESELRPIFGSEVRLHFDHTGGSSIDNISAISAKMS